MRTLVVNLFAGPGAGKSTTAADLFAKLKAKGIGAELVQEYAKELVWAGQPCPFDQLEIFTEQRRRLRRVLGQVEVVVMDSPLLLNVIYGERESPGGLDSGLRAYMISEHRALSRLDVFLRRQKPYIQAGRHVDAKTARLIDAEVLTLLDELGDEHYLLEGASADVATLLVEWVEAVLWTLNNPAL